MNDMTWAVVQCKSQREHAVRLLLGRMNLECYLPRIRVRKRITPLFPGYLFTRLGQQFYSVLWTPHVIRLLMAGLEPARLDDNVIAELRRRERGGLVQLPQPPRLRRGQPVRLTRGSFAGCVGLYDGMATGDRQRVLLELLGRKVRIELDTNAVASLDVAPELASTRNVR
jgi:transcriptional antiterminator RfaH